jgi:RNA polymerase sigma-70 factor (ECF subfamily)
VRGAPAPEGDRRRQREIVGAFLAAARGGDFAHLLSLLDPNVVLRADAAAVLASATRQAGDAPKLRPETRGAVAVAEVFSGRAAAARPALINGTPGLAWAPGGQPRALMQFTVTHGSIVAIDLIFGAERIRQLDVALLTD